MSWVGWDEPLLFTSHFEHAARVRSATANLILAADDSQGACGNSDPVTFHLHADYYLTDWISPVVERNGYLAQDPGGLGVSGVDASSLAGGEENDTYTVADGAEIRPLCENFGLRLAYETELNDNVSLFGDRWTLSAIYEF